VHEEVVAWLTMKLTPFVHDHRLGMVYHPRSVIQIGNEQTEPDLMVRPIAPLRGWENAPLPMLVVEVISRSTRHRDLGKKRTFYVANGVAEYWVVDRDRAVVLQIRGQEERAVSGIVRWCAPGTTAVLEIDVAAMFAEIRSRS
jgi:Uma2 family endonuclease